MGAGTRPRQKGLDAPIGGRPLRPAKQTGWPCVFRGVLFILNGPLGRVRPGVWGPRAADVRGCAGTAALNL